MKRCKLSRGRSKGLVLLPRNSCSRMKIILPQPNFSLDNLRRIGVFYNH